MLLKNVFILDTNMLRASFQLLSKNRSQARRNFQQFQLEHGIFINKKTNQVLAEATQKSHIREAFKKLSKVEVQLFEKESPEWQKFLIGKNASSMDSKNSKSIKNSKSTKRSKPSKKQLKSIPEKLSKKVELRTVESEPKPTSKPSKMSTYTVPEKTQPTVSNPNSITGKDVFKNEMLSKPFFAASIEKMNDFERSAYLENQWDILNETTKQLYIDEATS